MKTKPPLTAEAKKLVELRAQNRQLRAALADALEKSNFHWEQLAKSGGHCDAEDCTSARSSFRVIVNIGGVGFPVVACLSCVELSSV